MPPSSIRAQGSSVYVGDPLVSEFRVLDLNGKLIRVVRTADTPQPVKQADIAAGRVGFTVREMPSDGRPGGPPSTIAPETYPAFSQILVDPTGSVWMQDAYHVVPQGWTLFDATGRLRGRLIPRVRPESERWTILAFGVTDVLVSRHDEDGAAHITIYPLTAKH